MTEQPAVQSVLGNQLAGLKNLRGGNKNKEKEREWLDFKSL